MQTKRIMHIRLGNTGLDARIEITREGQQKPDVGDGVKVKVCIHLPTNHEGRLEEAIAFGHRVSVAGASLQWDWQCAYNCKDTLRRTETLIGPKYEPLFAAAETWATAQLQPLLDAISVREQALKDAE